MNRKYARPIPAATTLAAALAAALVPSPALAETTESPLSIEASYTADLSAVAAGPQTGLRHTEIARLFADLSLEQAIGWDGARLFAHGIASTGQRPNDLAGTLQGVNNIEVPENRAKLFEFYLEQALGGDRGSLRVGFSDLNAEFYVTDASALLIAPAFGIGSELSATGPNGPSLFPSTALTARVRYAHGAGGYVQAAVFNAEAGVLGDRGGIRPLFGQGALLIAEAGHTFREGRGKLAGGAWTYTARQPDLRDVAPDGSPAKRRAFGFYALGELPLDQHTTLFARAGVSDGRSNPYQAGWQLGVLAEGFWPRRPAAQFSIGLFQAALSDRFRPILANGGPLPRRLESGLELTWSDEVAPWLRLQPDFQFIRTALRDPAARNAAVFTLRASFSFPAAGQD